MSIFNAQALPQVKAEIYFGLSIPNGTKHGARVSDADWDEFLAESVTPHFPGFTVDYATGYWKGAREDMQRVTILADDTSTMRAQCRVIAEHYKCRFNQEAVGISFTACAFTMETWPHGPVRLYHQLDKGTAANAEAIERAIVNAEAALPDEYAHARGECGLERGHGL